MNDFKSQKIKSSLKSLFKKKQITYEDISIELECSVPTVKRILGPEELTLSRLLQLCEILNISLTDLETMTEQTSETKESFSKEQELFLAKNSHYLAYLIQLYSGESPQQIAEKNQLTSRSTDRYLLNLEKMDLIRVTGKQKVKPTFKDLPGFGSGPLARAYFDTFISAGAQFFKEFIGQSLSLPEQDRKNVITKFSMQALKVSPDSYRAFTEARNRALYEFEKLAAFEEKTKNSEDLMVAVVTEANALVKPDNKLLRIVENSFGKISNI